jgi:polysaccharide biosynthesis/export protein
MQIKLAEQIGATYKMTSSLGRHWTLGLLAFVTGGSCLIETAPPLSAQTSVTDKSLPNSQNGAIDDYNRRLEQLRRTFAEPTIEAQASEYRIGPDDLIDITVFESPDLNASVRVSSSGEVSLPLVGATRAGGLTTKEFEVVLSELLRRRYMKDPHVTAFVHEVQSHPVSVFGAVKRPGVFQIRGTKTLLEVLSLSEGLADDAGDTVLVMRGAGLRRMPISPAGQMEAEKKTISYSAPSQATEGLPAVRETPNTDTIEINLKKLLDSGDSQYNVIVHPGDIVKVTRAGIVYVVGEVKKPGGFVLKSNENISVLQALALAEGLTRTSAKSQARIIRTDQSTEKRSEIKLDIGKILSGSVPDPMLYPKDVVFIPNSNGKTALYRGSDAAISILTGITVYRR